MNANCRLSGYASNRDGLNATEQIAGGKHQITHEQDHEAAMDMWNRDVSIVNDDGDQGYNDGYNERDNSRR
jgi:hypothetical protein